MFLLGDREKGKRSGVYSAMYMCPTWVLCFFLKTCAFHFSTTFTLSLDWLDVLNVSRFGVQGLIMFTIKPAIVDSHFRGVANKSSWCAESRLVQVRGFDLGGGRGQIL